MPTPPSLWTDRPDHWLEAPAARPAPTPSPSPTPPSGPSPSRRRRRRAVAAIAAVTLLGAGGVGGALVTDDGDDSQPNRTAAALPAAAGQVPAAPAGEIYAKASRAVVSVRVRGGGRSGSGTGFLIDADGTLVTNAHVVDKADTVEIRFDDGRRAVAARVVGTDVSTDLALLEVPAAAIPGGVEPLQLADSSAVNVGDAAIAIGYPLGLDQTATSGIVSGLGRQIRAPNGFSIDEVIQTDAPINPGNSGGPLLDAAGRVIGVNSQIATSSAGGGSVGIGFAVPADTVREVVPQLQAGGSIRRAYLGVSSTEPPAGDGAQIATVTPGSPAQRSGLRPGDVVVRADGEPVRAPDDLGAAIEDDTPGKSVELELRRDGRSQTVTVTLGTRPEQVTTP